MRMVHHQHRELGHVADVGTGCLQRNAQIVHGTRDLAREVERQAARRVLAALPRDIDDADRPFDQGHVRIAVGPRVIQAVGVEQAQRVIQTGEGHDGRSRRGRKRQRRRAQRRGREGRERKRCHRLVDGIANGGAASIKPQVRLRSSAAMVVAWAFLRATNAFSSPWPPSNCPPPCAGAAPHLRKNCSLSAKSPRAPAWPYPPCISMNRAA
ncbi:hypothetical protein CBM2589_A90655 [Cupriavidus taiwanensis]|uniref:Uncharacterized protein n=1 Tax=Cupriavidus taiwanensis TaxID=164546 RepID=A0A976A9K8_9BURK|nr:hypothetical protein CBM2589_A90655 [Cupriavidus taiwanensis]